MESGLVKKLLVGAAVALGLWLGARYVLPVALPFLLGGLLALAAEPAVAFSVRKFRMNRKLAAILGVSLTILFSAGLIWLAAALAVRELGQLAADLPDLQDGKEVLRGWLTDLANRAPENIRNPAQQMVTSLFEDKKPLARQLSDKLPGMVGNFVSSMGNGLLGIGTGILSAFLISARLPALREKAQNMLPQQWQHRCAPALKRVRGSLGGWFKAQIKLSAVTWALVSVGFWLLRIPDFFLWAALVALVDAVPILGTGTVLAPWSLICFLQGETFRGVGLLCLWASAVITRTVLEPRLMGKHLGMDPLTTLVALYAGFRLWGVVGLLLTPILTSAAKSLIAGEEG